MAKRAILAILLLVGFLLPLFAVESEYFVKTVLIEKVYPHSKGYRVLYVKSNLQLGEIYLPHSWFYQAGGKGELVYGDDPSYPFFSVFYKDGEFSHIRLYLKRDYNDPSWGVLRNPDQYDDKFNVDTLEIEY